MNRYPHNILIERATANANDPFAEMRDDGETVGYEKVYEGKGRCWLNGQSRFRSNKVMDSVHCVSIPDPRMPVIGENYRVSVEYPQNGNIVVGFVKDFVPFDRNCVIYFQFIKENMIAEDMPKVEDNPFEENGE